MIANKDQPLAKIVHGEKSYSRQKSDNSHYWTWKNPAFKEGIYGLNGELTEREGVM